MFTTCAYSHSTADDITLHVEQWGTKTVRLIQTKRSSVDTDGAHYDFSCDLTIQVLDREGALIGHADLDEAAAGMFYGDRWDWDRSEIDERPAQVLYDVVMTWGNDNEWDCYNKGVDYLDVLDAELNGTEYKGEW